LIGRVERKEKKLEVGCSSEEGGLEIGRESSNRRGKGKGFYYKSNSVGSLAWTVIRGGRISHMVSS